MKILLMCFLGLPWAAGAAALGDPLGPNETDRLLAEIERYYQTSPHDPVVTQLFAPGRFEGFSAASLALGRVVHHMKEPGTVKVVRTIRMLEWIHTLVVTAEARDAPFLRQNVRRNLWYLIEHFRGEPRVGELVAEIIEATSLWTSDFLPALARQAGRAIAAEATWFANFALDIPDWQPDHVQRMVEVIRQRPVAQRTPEQWALLGSSGSASVGEYAHILQLTAHAYALRDVTAPSFQKDHPLHKVLLHLMSENARDRLYIKEVLTIATEQTKKGGNRHSPLAERQHFYRAFWQLVFLDPTDPSVTFPLPGAALPPAPPEPPPVSNVVYPEFGCRSRLER